MKSKRNDINIADECKTLRSFHLILLLKDGIKLDGIIQDINEESESLISNIGFINSGTL